MSFCAVLVVPCLLCRAWQSESVIRFGLTKGGHPRYRCKTCGIPFSDAPTRSHDEAFKEQVLAAYQERASMRGIARVFGISRNTLAQWLREKGGTCPP